MSEHEPIRLVCFDWGGVILKICRSFAEGCAAAGLPVRADVQDTALAQHRRKVAWRYQRGELSCEEYFKLASEQTNGLYTPDEVRLIHDAWLLEEYPGVGELVDRLSATPGIQTGLLSNTNPRHWLRRLPGGVDGLPHFPTIEKLSHRHASHLLGEAKPDEAVYRKFERESGFDAPSILFFDDLEDNINAARNAGWNAVLIDHEGDTAAQIDAALRRLRVWG